MYIQVYGVELLHDNDLIYLIVQVHVFYKQECVLLLHFIYLNCLYDLLSRY